MKFKKGDKVKVTVGKDYGRDGIIERLYPKQGTVLVTGVNMVKKHLKKSEQNPQGGVAEVSRPLAVSNLILICPKCKKPSKIGYKIEKGEKKRVCRACESKI